MAEIFPDEGLDHILAIFPANGAGDATLYIGLFTSQTASTVPARTAQNVGPVGWTEATGSGVDVFITPAGGPGGILVHHPMPDWYSLAPYKYALAEAKRKREEDEIMVIING